MRIQNFPIFNISQELDLNESYSAIKRKDTTAIRECIRQVASEKKVFNTLLHSFQPLTYFAIGYIKDSQTGQYDPGSDFFRAVYLNDSVFSPVQNSIYRSSPVHGIVFGGFYLTMPILLVESEPLDVFNQKGDTVEEALAKHNAQEDSRFIFVELFKIICESKEQVSIDGSTVFPITEHHADLIAAADRAQSPA